MKKLFILLLALLASITFSFGQILNDTISIQKKGGSLLIYQHDKKLTPAELKETLQVNPYAYAEYQKAASNKVLSSIIGGVGGFMVGWPLGTALAGGESNWTVAGIGAGLIAVSIPISIKANKQSKSAVNTYNRHLRMKDNINKQDLRMGFCPNGLNLCLRF